MVDKRFKKMDTIIDPFPIWDSVEEKGYNCTDTLDVLVDLLNELAEENEQLRHELDSLTGCYCADNKEFKDYWRIGYDD